MVSGELRARAALPPENNPGTHSTVDWVSTRTGLIPAGIRTLGRAALSQVTIPTTLTRLTASDRIHNNNSSTHHSKLDIPNIKQRIQHTTNVFKRMRPELEDFRRKPS
jgi:hypothetical protein